MSGNICRNFCLNTTAHGFARAAKSKGLRRIVWIFFIVFATAVILGHFIMRIQQFASFPTNLHMSYHRAEFLHFPAVTVCVTSSSSPLVSAVEKSALQCSFGGKSCPIESIKESHTSLGPCITINATSDGKHGQSQGSDGVAGLHLQLNLNTTESSIVFEVHPTDEPPRMERKRLFLDPGHQASVPVSLTQYHNLPAPYGDCEDRTLKHFTKYSVPGCIAECLFEKVVKDCECAPPLLSGGAVRTCTSAAEQSCLNGVQDTINKAVGDYCSCPESCRYTVYDAKLSYRRLPKNQVDRETTVILDVFFESQKYLVLEQTATLTVNDMIAGLAALIIAMSGVSVLTMIEFCEFFIDLCVAFCCRKQKSHSKAKDEIGNDSAPSTEHKLTQDAEI